MSRNTYKYLTNDTLTDILINKCFFESKENIEEIDYLLRSPDLLVHADIHGKNDYVFIYCCSNDKKEYIKYLIFYFKIKFTEKIQLFINSFDKKSEIIEMFKKRDLLTSSPA